MRLLKGNKDNCRLTKDPYLVSCTMFCILFPHSTYSCFLSWCAQPTFVMTVCVVGMLRLRFTLCDISQYLCHFTKTKTSSDAEVFANWDSHTEFYHKTRWEWQLCSTQELGQSYNDLANVMKVLVNHAAVFFCWLVLVSYVTIFVAALQYCSSVK